MTVPRPPVDDAEAHEFGTAAFYAAIGRAFIVMCGVVLLLFAINLVNALEHYQLDQEGGIVPREPRGLVGVIFSPFLHASWDHVTGNATPLLIAGTFVLATGVNRFLAATALIMVIGGIGEWWVLPSGYVGVGASGVIFGYLGFLVIRGLIERTWWSLGVAVLIGALEWYSVAVLFPNQITNSHHIAWQAHLFGLLGGVIAAFLFRRPRRRKPVAPTKELPTTITLPTIG